MTEPHEREGREKQRKGEPQREERKRERVLYGGNGRDTERAT